MRSTPKLAIVGALIAAMAVSVSACAGTDEEKPAKAATKQQAETPAYTASPKEVRKLREEQKAQPEDDFFVTAKMIVDYTFAEPGSQEKFCELHETLGAGIGWEAWRDGYGKPAPNTAKPRAIYEEMVSRC
jgi:hypothetical protein